MSELTKEEIRDYFVQYGFLPNWIWLGFKNKEECVKHIFNFLRVHEKQLLSKAITDEITIIRGSYVFTLGKGYDKKEGLQKYRKKSNNTNRNP